MAEKAELVGKEDVHLDVRDPEDQRELSYHEIASCWGRLTIAWPWPLVKASAQKTRDEEVLEPHHLRPLPPWHKIRLLDALYEDAQAYLRSEEPPRPTTDAADATATEETSLSGDSSLNAPEFKGTAQGITPLIRTLWTAGIIKVLRKSLSLWIFGISFKVGVVLLFREILEYIKKHGPGGTGGDLEPEVGVPLAIGLAACIVCDLLTANHAFRMAYETGIQVRSLMMSQVYQKAMRLSLDSRTESTTGEILNYMSNDCNKFNEATRYAQFGPWAVANICVFTPLLFWQLGWSALMAVGLFALMPLLSRIIMKIVVKYKEKMLKATDARVKLLTEILQGIQLVKMYSWEKPFVERLQELRNKELDHLFKVLVAKLGGINLPFVYPWICIFFTIVVYVETNENDVTIVRIFTAISIMNYLRQPFIFLNIFATQVGEFKVALARLERFLSSDEIERCLKPLPGPEKVTSLVDDGSANGEIKINGSFSRNLSTPSVCLLDINLDIKPGELVAVVGRVGAGKSTLLEGILGELYSHADCIRSVGGRIGYQAQSAWVKNASVRENILMGQKYEKGKYDRTIKRCALVPDFEQFQDGDLTEVGERGITISGGQKARICLARLIYRAAETDIFLLDDFLAAVDVDVANQLWLTLRKKLEGKTRLVVMSSHFDLLDQFDRILVMETRYDAEGKNARCGVRAFGPYAELLHLSEELGWSEKTQAREDTPEWEKTPDNSPRGSLRLSLDGSLSPRRRRSKPPTSPISKKLLDRRKTTALKEGGAFVKKKTFTLIDKEDQVTGGVGWDVWRGYFSTASDGRPWLVIFAACTVFLFSTVAPKALQIGIAAWITDEGKRNEGKDPKHDTAWWIRLNAIFAVIAIGSMVLKSFLVIINMWASKGLHYNVLKHVMQAPVIQFFQVTPVGRIINRFAGDLDLCDNTLPEMMNQSISIFFAILGIFVMVAYNSPWFIVFMIPLCWAYWTIFRYFSLSARQMKRLELLTKSPIFSRFEETLNGLATIRSLQLEEVYINQMRDLLDRHGKVKYMFDMNSRWLGLRIDFIAAVVVGFACLIGILLVQELEPGLIAVTIVFTIELVGMSQWGIRCWVETETQMCAVERITHYTHGIPQEPLGGEKPPKGWLSEGRVEFDNVKLRYRPELPLVLKGLQCTVEPGEKVGVIGRTGAGKSTIMVSLFRIAEPEPGTTIRIDGRDYQNINLESLRKEIAIIPQESVLFTGTLRWNLDPFSEHPDEELWSALEDVQLANHVRSLGQGLEAPIAERGSNWSVGERQLLCIARALLRKAKLVLLDEATASVDTATDRIIQQVLDNAFKGCTVITIAHRLDTIANSDKIMVLEEGKVKEFDSPEALMLDEHSVYRSIMKEANEEQALIRQLTSPNAPLPLKLDEAGAKDPGDDSAPGPRRP